MVNKLYSADLTFLLYYSLSTQEHHTSANQMKKLLCEFINSILTDLEAGKLLDLNLHSNNSFLCSEVGHLPGLDTNFSTNYIVHVA